MVQLRIKQILNNKGVTQVEVARRLNVAPMTVSNWITGRRYPSIEILERLADMLGVDIVDFFIEKLPTSAVTLQARVGDSVVDLTPDLIAALSRIRTS